jgi:deferrochelatase/peroxidase EfeB
MTLDETCPANRRAACRRDAPVLSRRDLLLAGTAYGLGLTLTPLADVAHAGQAARAVQAAGPVLFYGTHQAGIATRSQQYLAMAAFDMVKPQQATLRSLLQAWSGAAAKRTAASASRLTVTFGFGPSLFSRAGDPFGLSAHRPPVLAAIPPMPGDQLDPARSDGDLGVQLCGDDQQVILNTLHHLESLSAGIARRRWLQLGFGPTGDGVMGHRTPRNLMGFKDGTDNIPGTDPALLQEEVWVSRTDGPAWMAGGTYMAVRRIRMHLDVWKHQTLETQEETFGRHKASGAPLGGDREFDPINLEAQRPDGEPWIPLHAHIRLAREGQRRILRRGYAFNDGRQDAGLFFIAFQRDIRRQFLAIQRQLAAHDALNRFITHTSSAVFACPPGTRSGGYVGETLFNAL